MKMDPHKCSRLCAKSPDWGISRLSQVYIYRIQGADGAAMNDCLYSTSDVILEQGQGQAQDNMLLNVKNIKR